MTFLIMGIFLELWVKVGVILWITGEFLSYGYGYGYEHLGTS